MQPLSAIQPGPGLDLSAPEAPRQSAFARGRQRWGALGLSFDQFAEHLDRLGWSRTLPSRVEELYLCAACQLGLEAACCALDRTYFPQLEISLRQLYQCPAFVDDVLQLTRERLLVPPSVRIASYRGDGCLLSWLRIIVRRMAVDLRRGDGARRRLQLAEWQRSQTSPAPSDWLTDMSGCAELGEAWIGTLTRALSAAIADLDRSESQLLHAYYVKRIQVDPLGKALGIDRSTVYRRLRGAECRLKRSIRSAVRAQAQRLTGDEIDRLLHASYERLGLDSSIWDTIPA